MLAFEAAARGADVGGMELAGGVGGEVLDVDYRRGAGVRVAEGGEEGGDVGCVGGVGAGGAPVGGVEEAGLVVD